MPNSGFSWGAKLSEIADAVWTRIDRNLDNRVKQVIAKPSENIVVSLPTERTVTSTSYVLVKRAIVNIFGRIRTTFECKVEQGAGSGLFYRPKVTRNDAIVYEPSIRSDTTYYLHSVDFIVSPTDIIEWWLTVGYSGNIGYMRNVTIKYDVLAYTEPEAYGEID